MNIHPDQLPHRQFEHLGISKERLQQWPKEEMQKLLSGYPSDMKSLVFRDGEGKIQKAEARLSVYQASTGTIGLKIHPYREQIRDDMGLTDRELTMLQSGQTVMKNFNNREYLVQLDTGINELCRVRLDHIRIAEAIGDTKLRNNQKAALLSGKPVYLTNAKGITMKVSLDLKDPSGIKVQEHNQQLSRKQKGEHQEIKSQESYSRKR